MGTEIDVFGPFEVLSSVGFDVGLVASERPGPVVSSGACG
jgi:hypothetical protein